MGEVQVEVDVVDVYGVVQIVLLQLGTALVTAGQLVD